MGKWVLAAMLLAAAGNAWAEPETEVKPAAEPKPEGITWKSDAELGVIVTNGNSQTRNINTRISLLNERPWWRHQAKAEGLKSSNREGTTAEKYFLTAKTNYKFSQRNYIFLLVNYEDDRFSGYEYQASESLGYGHRFVPGTDVTLDTEVGVGVRQSRLDDTGENNTETLARLAATLDWKISGTSVFKQELSAEIGEDNTVTRSVTALKSKVTENLSMALTFTAKRNSDVPPGVRNTDTETAVALVYNLL